MTYSATTVLPLDVGALTSTPRDRSSLTMAWRWKPSRRKGRVAWYPAISASTSSGRPPFPSYMEQFEARPGDQRLAVIVDEAKHLLAHLVGMAAVRADADHTDDRGLPEILVAHLGDGHVEGLAQAGGQRAQHLPLVLQRGAGRNLKVDGESADDHRARSVSRTTKRMAFSAGHGHTDGTRATGRNPVRGPTHAQADAGPALPASAERASGCAVALLPGGRAVHAHHLGRFRPSVAALVRVSPHRGRRRARPRGHLVGKPPGVAHRRHGHSQHPRAPGARVSHLQR